MLNISGLNEGIVLDHIQAGKSLDIYYHLGLRSEEHTSELQSQR